MGPLSKKEMYILLLYFDEHMLCWCPQNQWAVCAHKMSCRYDLSVERKILKWNNLKNAPSLPATKWSPPNRSSNSLTDGRIARLLIFSFLFYKWDSNHTTSISYSTFNKKGPKHQAGLTLQKIRWLGHRSAAVEDLDAEALHWGTVQPVPHQEGAIVPVQGRRDVDADMIFRVQRADLHCESVFP